MPCTSIMHVFIKKKKKKGKLFEQLLMDLGISYLPDSLKAAKKLLIWGG